MTRIRRIPTDDEQPDGTVEVPISTLLTLCRWADNEAMPIGYWMEERAVGDAVHEAYELLDLPLRREDVTVDLATRLEQRADQLAVDVTAGDDADLIEVTSLNRVFGLEASIIERGINEGDHRLQVTFVDDVTTGILLGTDD